MTYSHQGSLPSEAEDGGAFQPHEYAGETGEDFNHEWPRMDANGQEKERNGRELARKKTKVTKKRGSGDF